MSDSRWVITPQWLFGSLRSVLYSFSVYSCLLFLISSASLRSIPFLSFIEPIFAWNVPLVSLIFLKRSLIFPILLFPLFLCSVCWRRPSYLSLLFSGTLHSVGYIFPFLLCLSLLSFPHLFVTLLRQPLCLLSFCLPSPPPWEGCWSVPPICYEPLSVILQTHSLPDLFLELIHHLSCIIIRDLI